MWRIRHLFRRVAACIAPGRAERELASELDAHLTLLEDEYRRRGMGAEEAHRAARRALGGVEQAKELHREARSLVALERLRQDTVVAIRLLSKRPGFSFAVVLTLALGIGGLAAVFALVHAILIQPLPYTASDRLVAVSHSARGLGIDEAGLSDGIYFHYRENSRSLESLAVYRHSTMDLAGEGNRTAEQLDVVQAGPELFEVLDVEPVLGRMFTEEDAAPGFMDATWPIPVLLGHGLWQRRYGGDPEIAGQLIYRTNGTPREVVGVLPAGFDFPRSDVDVWMLFMPDPARADFARSLDYEAVGRLRPGVTADAAARELEALIPLMEGAYSDATPERMREVALTPVVVPLKDAVVGDAGTMLWLQLGGMAFLLLVGCLNVANLFLIRADDRAGEIAMRSALGARRIDLVRLFLGEAVLLSAAGSLLGLLLAGQAISVLVALAPVELPRLTEVDVDVWTVGFTAVIAVLAAFFVTGLSVLKPLRHAIPPGGKISGPGTTDARERRTTRNCLVAVQVALTLVLLVCSALILQSFSRLMRVDPGFDPANVLTVEIGIPGQRASREHRQIYGGVLDQIRALPRVAEASAINSLPLTGGEYAFPLRVPGRTQPDTQAVALKFFMPGYFQVVDTPVLEGTTLAPGGASDLLNPVVVSASLARRLFGVEIGAVGEQIHRLEPDGSPVDLGGIEVPPYTIAGVVGDVREESLRSRPADIVYVPIVEPRVERQMVPTHMTLVVRTDVPPLSLAGTVRELIAGFDPTMTVARVRTFDAIVRAAAAREEFLTVLLLVATVGSLFLAAVGIYGVVAYTVRRRSSEIGIRMALGARKSHIRRLVIGQTVVIVLIGLTFGLVTALFATRAFETLVFEVSLTDPFTMGGAAVLILAAALVASLLPASRAARADPMTSLRSE